MKVCALDELAEVEETVGIGAGAIAVKASEVG